MCLGGDDLVRGHDEEILTESETDILCDHDAPSMVTMTINNDVIDVVCSNVMSPNFRGFQSPPPPVRN